MYKDLINKFSSCQIISFERKDVSNLEPLCSCPAIFNSTWKDSPTIDCIHEPLSIYIPCLSHGHFTGMNTH